MPTGSGTPIIPQPQLDLGPAAWFRPEPESPPGNQLTVKAGFAYQGGHEVIDRFTAGDQTTAGFASVASGAGFKRYDLVYLNATGGAVILQGVDVATAAPAFDGAPGFNLGPAMPDQASPICYVMIDEVGAVTVDKADISPINGLFQITRDIDGYTIDKSLFGSAPTGASDDVSALFAGETPGGSAALAGVITSPPLNYVHIRQANGDEIQHTATGQIYGRLTEAAGVWTLTYFYKNASGVETAVVAIETEAVVTPTDLQLAGVPKTFSNHDPARPLFKSSHERQTDETVSTPGIGSVPLGGIIMWQNPAPAAPNPASPVGFEFCDGQTVTTVGSTMLGQTKADMMITSAGGTQRFPRGADVTASYGDGTALVTGGSDTIAVGGGSTGSAGSHSHSVANHTHSISAHTHSISSDGDHTHTVVAAGAGGISVDLIAGSVSTTAGAHTHGGVTGGGSGSTGSGGPGTTGGVGDHTHTFGAGPSVDNRPVFIETAFIVRVL